jgi:serine/threonine protein kinase/Tfp pilus assembly protein PilF
MNQPTNGNSVPPADDVPSEFESGNFTQLRSLKRELLAELRAGWKEGNPPRPEDLLARWPGDPSQDLDTASLLFEDYLQRREHDAGSFDKDRTNSGQKLSTSADQPGSTVPLLDEYQRRFPEQKDSLASLWRQHALLQSLEAGRPSSHRSSFRLALPGVGDELFGLPLRYELGRGAFARVFLAEQTGLADRPIVLKVSAIEGDEHQTLAQLQHTNIVPIYSVHEDARAGLRAVCMPYFGGASLSSVLRTLWRESARPHSGAQLVQALAMVQSPTIASVRSMSPDLFGPGYSPGPPEAAPDPKGNELKTTIDESAALHSLRGRSYLQATVCIVSRLAEALQHAHERNVLHRDIKPSNILLAADGQPMLLDFNLAQSGHGERIAATLGGTVAYMAPEHLRALAARDPALAREVDRRADIYSLGMVLYEMLAGKSPFDQSASYSPLPAVIEAMAVERSRTVPSLRKVRGDVPWSLESIARKCLAPDLAERYQQAEQLADDLRRFLDDRPLRYAPELSWRECARKWVRRHPRLTTSSGISALAALLLLTAGSILAGTRAQLDAAQERAYEAEGAEALQRNQAFEEDHRRALCLVNTSTELRKNLVAGQAACEQALGRYEILARDDWQNHRDWKRLPPEDRQQLAEDVREVLLLLARARVHLATAKTDRESLRVALSLVDRAEGISGLRPSPALWEDRAEYLKQLGEDAASFAASAKARAIPPAGARDHFWRATTLGFQGQYEAAIGELNQALHLNPRHYWSYLQRGICRLEMGDPRLAFGDFNACVALWPEFAWSYFNRGHVLDLLGEKSEALADYDATIARDADFVFAYVNRALVYLDTHRPAQALTDLDHAAGLGRDDVKLHAGRGLALEALGRPHEADLAFREAWKREPGNRPLLLAFGFAVSARLPSEARTAFAKVLDGEPRNTRALYGLGMLAAAKDRRSKEALALFTLAIEVDPVFVEARRGRANVLAHCGDWERARQDIDWCVKSESTGVTLYAAACVYALMAEKCANPALAKWAADRALPLLAAALERGYGHDKAAGDADLGGIRERAEFQQLLARKKS